MLEINHRRSRHRAWVRRRKPSFLTPFIPWPGKTKTKLQGKSCQPQLVLDACGEAWGAPAPGVGLGRDAAAFLQPGRGEGALLHAEHVRESRGIINQVSLNSSLYVFCYAKHYSSEGS